MKTLWFKKCIFFIVVIGLAYNAMAQNDAGTSILFFQNQIGRNRVIKYVPSQRIVFCRHEQRINIAKNLVRTLDYYENDSWTDENVYLFEWDYSKQKYVHYWGEKMAVYDKTCSVCKNNYDNALEEKKEREPYTWNMFPLNKESLSCKKHGYYYRDTSYISIEPNLQELYYEESNHRVSKYYRMEKKDYKSKVVGSYLFPSNIQFVSSDGSIVYSSEFLNKNKPTIILTHASWCKPSVRLQRALCEKIDEWGNAYGVEMVTIDVSDKGKREQLSNICNSPTYYDEIHDFRENFLIYYLPKQYSQTPIILILNKTNEMVYCWTNGYSEEKKDTLMKEIIQVLQHIK